MSKPLKRTLIDALKPYTVTVRHPEGETFKHKAWTTREALEWAGAYGKGWGTSTIRTRRGRFIASVTR